ncbi:MAG: flagellin [Phycisphaeraceae bacterium]|nr:flagellin [Phycisphaeraceae bacterium]
MSRINTNVNSLLAQRVLGNQNKSLSQSLERLSTGLRINRGADDPAGLIASEKLRSEKTSISAALSNAERADQLVNIAEGGLQEVNSLLLEVQNLVTTTASDAGLSTSEKEANQQQVDSILQTIDRIASTTSFQGTKLLNGSLDFQISSQHANVTDLSVNGAKITHGGTVTVNTVITNSAEHGSLFLSAGGTALDLTTASSTFEFELGGSKGSRNFSFSSGTTLASIATSINNFKSVTGVSAVASGNYIELKSTDFGSSDFVSFKLSNRGGQAGGLFYASAGNENIYTTTGQTAFTALSGAAAVRDTGADVSAIVNGVVARGKGKNVSVNTDALALSLDLSTTGAQTLGSFTAFNITGGGAKFSIGPTVDVNSQVRLGIGDVKSSKLGTSAVGFLGDLGSGKTYNLISGNLETGQKIVDRAIDQVSQLRSRLGSFQSQVVGSTINALGVALENTSAAESAIRDTDFASETANLTRSQILVQAAVSSVALARSAPQSVLQLLS